MEYTTYDAISKFPETTTALGVKLDDCNNIILAHPHGIADLIQLQIKPTPFFRATEEQLNIYRERLGKKNWKEIWGDLEIHYG